MDLCSYCGTPSSQSYVLALLFERQARCCVRWNLLCCTQTAVETYMNERYQLKKQSLQQGRFFKAKRKSLWMERNVKGYAPASSWNMIGDLRSFLEYYEKY